MIRTHLTSTNNFSQNKRLSTCKQINSGQSGFQKDRLSLMHRTIGNQAMGRLMRESSNTNHAENHIQRQGQSDSENPADFPAKTGCECDCGSYSKDIAWKYVNEKMLPNMPQLRLRFFWSYCRHQPSPPGKCSWLAVVVFEDVNTGDKHSIFIQLVNSNRIFINTHSIVFPHCEYDFKCEYINNTNKLILNELICTGGIYIPPGL